MYICNIIIVFLYFQHFRHIKLSALDILTKVAFVERFRRGGCRCGHSRLSLIFTVSNKIIGSYRVTEMFVVQIGRNISGAIWIELWTVTDGFRLLPIKQIQRLYSIKLTGLFNRLLNNAVSVFVGPVVDSSSEKTIAVRIHSSQRQTVTSFLSLDGMIVNFVVN